MEVVLSHQASLSRRGARGILADANSANVTAGLSAAMSYLFLATPVLFEAVSRLGLSRDAQVSWYVITFVTSAISGIILSLRYRMPVPIGWTVPGIVFLASSAATYSHGQIAAAVIVAGVAMVLIGATGISDRLLHLLPLPVIMGVFAGSVLKYVTGIFDHLQAQPIPVGAAIGGYLVAKALRQPFFPPMAGAFLIGIAGTALAGEMHTQSLGYESPSLVLVTPEFGLMSVIGLAVPLFVLSVLTGNTQGFGILRSEGFQPRVRLFTITMGITTLVNGIFGGHTSALQSSGTAIMGMKDAGPFEKRYFANVFAASLALVMAALAASTGALLGVFPAGFVAALAGLALMNLLLEGISKSVGSSMPTSGLVAMMIGASSLGWFGLGSAFWALVGGLLTALVLEREAWLGLRQASREPAQAAVAPSPAG